jgi:hypothetical protein
MSSNPTMLQMPSSASTNAQKRDGNNWIKIQHRLDSTLPVDISLFLNQPINPFLDSKKDPSSNTPRTGMLVQDSGVVMISKSEGAKSKSVSSSSKQNSSQGQIAPKPTQPGGEEIDDDWEVVYPDT